ncbi:P-loop containing nucleoside triphosphate hydrolase protein [Guyanagaster necrorhizus]|uniref:P-loop containing nucleoside triphosphate hydrolase protein n=1 Tax=Guyanagaster necrorhizus TaxID=856835 RepID=A0A9P7W003_9AGAR|nr:P-loop containing nucleoside triphosphate hydrolase protein [Guyanagaster necrorhizus MCA 3950]KAG7449667.1 P-loop containing nucleoside triphosphate hydrolase protein [Guyanagaster necrorhizus MCA 3950]
MSLPTAVNLISKHILARISPDSKKPIFVAIQGPQGSGKSYLTGLTQKFLTDAPHLLRVAVLSIDDLYLSHDDLVALALKHPFNPLWKGRGQPGTHDVELGIRILQSLREGRETVDIPRFDKSLFDGEGDRLPMDGSNSINPPIDIVIIEGWCMGFYPISQARLAEKWDGIWKEQKIALALQDELLESKECLQDINQVLKAYIDLWAFFDVFVQWRLEQEHNMKASNGGKGMSDDAVKSFVDRYIPGYVFFGQGVTEGFTDANGPCLPPWLGNGLRVIVDEKRQVTEVQQF